MYANVFTSPMIALSITFGRVVLQSGAGETYFARSILWAISRNAEKAAYKISLSAPDYRTPPQTRNKNAPVYERSDGGTTNPV